MAVTTTSRPAVTLPKTEAVVEEVASTTLTEPATAAAPTATVQSSTPTTSTALALTVMSLPALTVPDWMLATVVRSSTMTETAAPPPRPPLRAMPMTRFSRLILALARTSMSPPAVTLPASSARVAEVLLTPVPTPVMPAPNPKAAPMLLAVTVSSAVAATSMLPPA